MGIAEGNLQVSISDVRAPFPAGPKRDAGDAEASFAGKVDAKMLQPRKHPTNSRVCVTQNWQGSEGSFVFDLILSRYSVVLDHCQVTGCADRRPPEMHEASYQ